MSNLDTALQVFQDEAYLSMTELVANQIDLFNAATGGAITLMNGAQNAGDFSKEAYWKKISGLVRRRDPYDRSSTVSAVDIEQLLKVAVKVAAGTPPVNIDPDTLKWIGRAPEEYAQVIAAQLAPDMLEDMLESILVCIIAAIRNADGGNGTLMNDVTTGDNDGTATLRGLNDTAKLFGDRASAIKTWVIHSTPMHDIFDEALQNTNRLFEFGNVKVVEDGFGRRFVMTDAAALSNSGSPEGFSTLGLVAGAAAIEANDDFFSNTEISNGKENISATYQAEWSYNAGVKGYQWNTAVKAPTDAELATEANWTKIATSNKDTAGVIYLSD